MYRGFIIVDIFLPQKMICIRAFLWRMSVMLIIGKSYHIQLTFLQIDANGLRNGSELMTRAGTKGYTEHCKLQRVVLSIHNCNNFLISTL